MQESPESVLRRLNVPHEVADDRIHLQCPWCGHDGRRDKSVSMDSERGLGNCLHSNKCGQKWNLYTLRVKLGDPQLPNRRIKREVVVRTVRPAERDDKHAIEAAAWLKTREIDIEKAKRFHIYPCMKDKSPAVAFPYIREGKIVATKYRKKLGPNPGWKNFTAEEGGTQCLYGRDLIDMAQPFLMFVEAELDCIVAHQLGFLNTVSVPNSSSMEWIDTDWDWLQSFDTYYIATDMDPAGRKCAEEIATRLGREKCHRVMLPYKDLNDCLMKGWTSENIFAAVKQSKDMGPENLKNAAEYIDAVIQLRRRQKENPFGPQICFPTIHKKLRGMQPSSQVIIGWNAAGKSTLILQIISGLIGAGHKCATGNFEMNVAQYLDWQADQLMHGAYDEDTFRELAKTVWQHLFCLDHMGNISPQELIDTYVYAAKRYGVKHFFTDSLAFIGIESDDYAKQTEFIVGVHCNLVKQYGVSHTLIVHPRKGKTDNSTGADRVDAAGAAAITNQSDTVMQLRRFYKRDDDGTSEVILEITKNRLFGELGKVKLIYDKEKRMFFEVEKEALASRFGQMAARHSPAIRESEDDDGDYC